MSEKELFLKTVKELEVICKEKHLTYYSNKKHLTKAEMIKKIMNEKSEVSESVSEDVLAKEFSNSNSKVREVKEEYIENASIGTLVAFVDEHGKARTAAIVNRSTKSKKIKVETEFGREFIVPYDKVLWVRGKNERWPKGVYNMLKGKVAND